MAFSEKLDSLKKVYDDLIIINLYHVGAFFILVFASDFGCEGLPLPRYECPVLSNRTRKFPVNTYC